MLKFTEVKGGRMDKTLKSAIHNFFRDNYEGMIGNAEDFANELEEYLLDKKFDLESVCQYK